MTPTPTTLTLPSDHALVWSDEFAKDGLPDATKWVHETGRNKEGWYNNEKQYYSGPRLDNARVQDGVLTITARKEARSDQADCGGQAHSSTRLATLGKKDWTMLIRLLPKHGVPSDPKSKNQSFSGRRHEFRAKS